MLEQTTLPIIALLGPLGWPELLIIGILGVLIFGRRLPEVGKNIGKGIVEFKKGLSGIDEEIERSTSKKPPRIEKENTGTRVDMNQPEEEPAESPDHRAGNSTA